MVHAELKPYVGKLPPSVIQQLEDECPASKMKKVVKIVAEEFISCLISKIVKN